MNGIIIPLLDVVEPGLIDRGIGWLPVALVCGIPAVIIGVIIVVSVTRAKKAKPSAPALAETAAPAAPAQAGSAGSAANVPAKAPADAHAEEDGG